MSGKFIVIEGLEGAGKSTVLKAVKQFLQSHPDRQVIDCREPGGTRLGEMIRKMVKETDDSEIIDPRTELLLMYASRVQLLENVIKPALKDGKWVICDRFYYSTFAYQGGGRQIDLSVIEHIHQASLGDFKPDLALYMDISPEIGLQRAAGRGELDRFEREKIDFFNRTRRQYLKLAEECPEMLLVDASLPQDAVRSAVLKILQERFA